MTCICKQFETYSSGSHVFETQTASYTCGPIAILNALRYDGRPTGPAVHRQIMVACNPQQKHTDDGFKGTKPAYMDRVIRHLWPTVVPVAIGPEACQKTLRRCTAAILLYQRTPRNQHYVFVHRKGAVYQLENELDIGSTTVSDTSAYIKKVPMVWTIL
jgi:hypothetical protein